MHTSVRVKTKNPIRFHGQTRVIMVVKIIIIDCTQQWCNLHRYALLPIYVCIYRLVAGQIYLYESVADPAEVIQGEVVELT